MLRENGWLLETQFFNHSKEDFAVESEKDSGKISRWVLVVCAILPACYAADEGWVLRCGGPGGNGGAVVGGEIARAIDYDNQGNVFVVGLFENTITISSLDTAFKAAGKTDIVVIKINPYGTVLWVKIIGTSGNDGAYDLCCDLNGELYLAGALDASLDIDGITIPQGAFVARLRKTDGTIEMGVNTESLANELIVDTDGSIYLASTAMVQKLTPHGTVVWSIPLVSSYGVAGARGISIAADGSGDILVAGQFGGMSGKPTLTAGKAIVVSAGATDGFVARITSKGDIIFLKTVGGAGNDYCRATASNGNDFWVGGAFADSAWILGTMVYSHGGQDIFLARCNAEGIPKWIRPIGGILNEEGAEVSVNANSVSVIGGSYRGNLTIQGKNISSKGQTDFLVATLDSNGQVQWVLDSAGGALGDMCYACGIGNDGSVLMCGFFKGTATFGTTTLISAGMEDMVFGRFIPPDNKLSNSSSKFSKLKRPVVETEKALFSTTGMFFFTPTRRWYASNGRNVCLVKGHISLILIGTNQQR